MPEIARTWTGLLWLLLAGAFPAAGAPPARAPCGDALTQALPARPADAPGASRFVRRLLALDEDARETALRGALMSGNLPPFLRRLQPVVVESAAPQGRLRITLCVAPDYLAVGSDEDYALVPLRLQTALAFALRYGFVLPTRKMVDAIHRHAAVHLTPQPLPPGEHMRSTQYYWHHNALVRQQRALWPAPMDALIAGDKKDLVLTPRLRSKPDRVAIYGWHRPDGRAIQPLSTLHGERYADYSHGVRLVSATAFVDGVARPLAALLADPRYAPALSDEGVIPDASQLAAMLAARRP